MTLVALWDYQQQCIKANLASWHRGFYSNLNTLFTGAGKTEIFIHLLQQALNLKDQRALILAPAHLVDQTYSRMLLRVPAWEDTIVANDYKRVPQLGIEKGGDFQSDARMIVGSVPTLIEKNPEKLDPLTIHDLKVADYGKGRYLISKHHNSKRPVLVSKRIDYLLEHGLFDQIIYDEAHHAVSPAANMLRERIWQIDDLLGRKRTRFTGFTATAWRKDGIGLGNAFQCISFSRSFQWGMDNGYLAPLQTPIRVHAEIDSDKTKVLKVDNWTDLIVKAWEEKASDRLSLGYGPSVEDSEVLARAFQARGHRMGYVDALKCIDAEGNERPKNYQSTLLRQAYNHEINGIINYGVFLEGTDLPPASCLIWARPVEDNPTITTQAIGRVLRLHPGKEDALILDCTSQNLEILGGGTLAGYRYDEESRKYVKAEDEEVTMTEVGEEIDTTAGIDIRDTQKGTYNAQGVIYSIGRTIRRSGSNWHHNEENDVLTLGVSKKDMFVITAPYYTMAADLQYKADTLEETPENMPIIRTLRRVATFFESYTLWHVQDEKLREDNPIFSVKDSLNQLMDFVTVYMSEFETIEAFYKRGKRWVNSPLSDKQAGKLRELGVQPNPLWTQGEASQTISYIIAYRNNVLLEIGRILLDCGKFLDVSLLKYNQELLSAVATVYKMQQKKQGVRQ